MLSRTWKVVSTPAMPCKNAEPFRTTLQARYAHTRATSVPKQFRTIQLSLPRQSIYLAQEQTGHCTWTMQALCTKSCATMASRIATSSVLSPAMTTLVALMTVLRWPNVLASAIPKAYAPSTEVLEAPDPLAGAPTQSFCWLSVL